MEHPRNEFYRLMKFKDSDYSLRTVDFTRRLLDEIMVLIEKKTGGGLHLKSHHFDPVNGELMYYTCKIRDTFLQFVRDCPPEQSMRWELSARDMPSAPAPPPSVGKGTPPRPLVWAGALRSD